MALTTTHDHGTAAPTAFDPTGPSPWRAVLGVGVLLTVVASVLLIAFAWPASRSALHDVPLAVAGPPPAVEQFTQRLASERPDAFVVEPVADRAAAVAAIQDREVYGAVVIGAQGPQEVLTASAASPAVAQGLTQLAHAIGAAAAPAGPATGPQVSDVVAAPADDPRGAGLAAGALPLVLAGIIAAGVTTLRLRGASRRITAALLFAVLGGATLAGILQGWLGVVAGNYWLTSSVIALGIAAVALPLLGLEWLIGTAGLGLGAAVMMLLGNPLSGLSSAPEMLPEGWGTLGQLLPPGATGNLLRSVAFFDGAAAAGPVTVLATWALAGGALCLAAAARRRA